MSVNNVKKSLYNILDEKIQQMYALDKLYNLNVLNYNFPSYEVFKLMWWSKYYKKYSKDTRVGYYIYVINEFILGKLHYYKNTSNIYTSLHHVTNIENNQIYYSDCNMRSLYETDKVISINKFFDLLSKKIQGCIKC